MPRIDLTHFGFTPTESLVYEVLLTGWARHRATPSPVPPGSPEPTRTARSRAWSPRAPPGWTAAGPSATGPRPPPALIARISTDHGLALERLSTDLDAVSVPATPTLVEIESGRAVLQLITHDVARAAVSVALLAPADAYPLLAPALRRPYSAGLPLLLCATGPVDLGFAVVEVVQRDRAWPGMPIISVVDDRSAILAARQGSEVRGHWSTAPAFVAGARLALEQFRRAPMSDPLDDALLELQREYLAEFPERLEELRATSRPSAPSGPRRRRRSRRASIGSPARAGRTASPRSASSRARWSSGWPPSRRRGRRRGSTRRWTGWRRCSARPRPASGTPARPPAPRLRATVILPPSPEAERLAAALEAEGYEVRLGHRHEDPADAPAGRTARPAGDRDRRRRGRPVRGGVGVDRPRGPSPGGRADRDAARGGPAPGHRVGRGRGGRRRADARGPAAVRPHARAGRRAALDRAAGGARRRARRRRWRAAWRRRTSGWSAARWPRRCRSCSTARCPISCCSRPACLTARGPRWRASSARIRAFA